MCVCVHIAKAFPDASSSTLMQLAEMFRTFLFSVAAFTEYRLSPVMC